MDCPSNMEIDLCWYQIRTNKKWTYNFTDHWMIDLETKIAITSITCIVGLDAYKLHLGDENVFNDFMNEF